MSAAAPRRDRLAPALGLLLSLAALLLQAQYQRHAGALWRDEVTSVNVASLPDVAAVYAHSHLDSFPTAWVLVLHGWIAAGFGDDDAGLRRIGVAVTVGLLAALWWSGRRLGLAAPLLGLLLFACSPTTVIYAGSVRGYGLGALAIVASLGAIHAFSARPTWGRWLVALAAAALAAQTYFGNCFLLVAVCAAGMVTCWRRGARGAAAAVLAVGVGAAASMSVNLFSVAYARELSPLEQGSYGPARFAAVFREALAPDVPLLAVAWGLAACAGLAGLVLALRGAAGAAERERALFVAVAAGGGVLAYLAYLSYISVPTQYWYYLGPMALLALAADVGVDILARRLRRADTVRLAAVALVAVLAAPALVAAVPLRMTNVDLLAARVAELARPGDLVVVFPWYCGITFARYFTGATPWITVPDFDEHRFHLHAEIKRKMMQGDEAFRAELARVEQTLRAGGRVWVLGPLAAPPPGAPAPQLPPAPHGPRGWQAAPYLDGWELQLGALLRAHATTVDEVAVAQPARVNTWERLPLLVAEGWR